jgi:GGDEF domain-containing protein/CHASE3 domain sensor protein
MMFKRRIDISLTLRQKIFLGYAVMIFFTIIVGLYAIWSLSTINKITTTVIYDDAAALEKLKKLNDSILAQDLYEKRYLVFQDINAEDIFWNRSSEFKSLITETEKIYPSFLNILNDLSSAHEDYDELFKKEVSLLKKNNIKDAEKLSSTELKNYLNKVLSLLKNLEMKLKAKQTEHISKSNILGGRSFIITITLSIVSIVFGILFAYLITNSLSSSIEKLKEATYSIKSGDFDTMPDIKGADELADLAISFKEMSARLKELEATNLDANPLTKLPGNLAIEKELLTRLNENENFSFCLIDLDNFKAFSDRYGFAKGSEVLKWLGDILSEIMKTLGTDEDFLGHIGGDDFVITCAPERMESICSMIIEKFDKGIVNHYEPEDLERGYIVSIDRKDKPAIFPIMTISIAVVNTDRTVIREPKEVAEKVAELKQYAKTFAKSIYVVDRRRKK